MNQDEVLRNQLVKLMRSGQAFKPREEILAGITLAEASHKIPALPYTLWQVIAHLRIALYDILDFSCNPEYKAPAWPEGYWPPESAPAHQAELDQSIETIQAGMWAMEQLILDPGKDLYKPFPHGDGQNLLREAMLVAEHNAYHLGEIVLIRRLLGTWK